MHARPSALAETPIGADLHDDGFSFEFFQAVSLLQRLMSDRRPVGHFSSPDDEAVRFRVNPRLASRPARSSNSNCPKAPAEMMVNFMGLTGPQGVLPHSYSELILERLRAKDRSLAAFFDIFNHRAISLFYRAWQRTRISRSIMAPATRDHFQSVPARPARPGDDRAERPPDVPKTKR